MNAFPGHTLALVSFLLHLEVTDLSPEQGRAVEASCRLRQAWPVRFVPGRPRRWWRKLALAGPGHVPPRLDMPAEQPGLGHLLSDDADWDAPSWAMRGDLLPALAESIRILGEHLPQGSTFQATWVGSEVRHVRVLTAAQLAEVVLASALNEFTRYVVRP